MPKMVGPDGQKVLKYPFPQFVCLGFQKSGTTTLFEILRQHPGIVLCRDVKEPMYYRVLALRALGGDLYYRFRYFGHTAHWDAETRLIGEVNAGLTFTHCAEKICHDFPAETKLVFMMREPVARTYSAYKYFLARGYMSEDVVRDDIENGHAAAFDRYVRSVLDDPAQRGKVMRERLKYLVFSQSNYATCVEEYLDHFPLSQVKPIFFEEFIKDQHAACLDLYDFLGIEDSPAVDYSVRGNEGTERPVSYQAAKRVQYWKGWNFGFYEFVGLPYKFPKAYGLFRKFYEDVRAQGIEPDYDRSKILPTTRAYLQDYYYDEVRRLEKIFGRDLSGLWF